MSFRRWASAYYLAYFAALGTLTPYYTVIYRRAGMDLAQIGILAAILPLTTLVANPLWGAAADAFRLHKRLLPLTIGLTLIPVGLLPGANSFTGFAVLIFLYAVCLAPIIPLSDNAVLSGLGERRYEYGRMRLWGAIGYGLSALTVGAMIEHWGANLAFYSYLVLMAICMLVSTRLPAPAITTSEPYWTNLRRLARQPRWYGFLFAAFMAGICFSVLNNYLVLFVTGLGAGEGLFGLSVALGNLSELPIFFLSAWMMRKWSPRGLISAALALLALRCLLTSLLVDPRWVVAIQLMHGMTFSASWAAMVTYANEIAPPGLGTSAQAIFGATNMGLAGIVGALSGGALYASLGPAALFRVAALAALAGFVVFGLSEMRAAAAVPRSARLED